MALNGGSVMNSNWILSVQGYLKKKKESFKICTQECIFLEEQI